MRQNTTRNFLDFAPLRRPARCAASIQGQRVRAHAQDRRIGSLCLNRCEITGPAIRIAIENMSSGTPGDEGLQKLSKM